MRAPFGTTAEPDHSENVSSQLLTPRSCYVATRAIALLGETAEKSGGAGARVALGWPGGRAFHDVNRQ